MTIPCDTQPRIDRLLAMSRACAPGSLAAARLEERAIACRIMVREDLRKEATK